MEVAYRWFRIPPPPRALRWWRARHWSSSSEAATPLTPAVILPDPPCSQPKSSLVRIQLATSEIPGPGDAAPQPGQLRGGA